MAYREYLFTPFIGAGFTAFDAPKRRQPPCKNCRMNHLRCDAEDRSDGNCSRCENMKTTCAEWDKSHRQNPAVTSDSKPGSFPNQVSGSSSLPSDPPTATKISIQNGARVEEVADSATTTNATVTTVTPTPQRATWDERGWSLLAQILPSLPNATDNESPYLAEGGGPQNGGMSILDESSEELIGGRKQLIASIAGSLGAGFIAFDGPKRRQPPCNRCRMVYLRCDAEDRSDGNCSRCENMKTTCAEWDKWRSDDSPHRTCPPSAGYWTGNAPSSPEPSLTHQSRNGATRSDDDWDEWWEENTKDTAALSKNPPNFDASSKVECGMLSRSVKIYQRLVVYVYVQMKVRRTTPEIIRSLRETVLKWGQWNDLQWLVNHHTVRRTLWETLDVGGTRLDDYECNLQNILDFDVDAIQRRVMTVLDDRQTKKDFFDLCKPDPTPVANLLQTLIDRDNLPPESQAKLVRTLARLAKLSRCYPDCLILSSIRRTGADPVAGGGFADVWRGYLAEKPVALKALRIYKQSLREKVLKEFSHEAVIWRQLKHPNILPFYGVFTGNERFDRLCLVSPWMDAGNVMDYLTIHPEGNRLSLLSDVAQGLEYLHLFQPPIIHGDLKGANIFVTPSHTACLADFGLARFPESPESSFTTTGYPTGTLRWQAPELLSIYDGEEDTIHRSEQSDIYSFGCVSLEFMTGKPPFVEIRQDGAVMRAILDGQNPQRPRENVLELGLDDGLWTLMQQCWDFDPASRPKTPQLVEHFKVHQREPTLLTDANADISQSPRASLDQYGFPEHFVLAVSGLTGREESHCVTS